MITDMIYDWLTLYDDLWALFGLDFDFFVGLSTGSLQAMTTFIGMIRPLTVFIDITALKVAGFVALGLLGIKYIFAIIHLLKP